MPFPALDGTEEGDDVLCFNCLMWIEKNCSLFVYEPCYSGILPGFNFK